MYLESLVQGTSSAREKPTDTDIKFSGNEIGPFRAIEESTLAQLTPQEIRSDIFAWYALLGNFGLACGTIASGWIVQSLLSPGKMQEIQAYRSIFGIYAILGFVKLVLSLLLSEKCEPEPPKQEYKEVVQLDNMDAEGLLSDSDDEYDHLNNAPRAGSTQRPKPAGQLSKTKKKSIWPAISVESRMILVKLCLLFAIDSLASGLVPLSWITYFFHQKFRIPEGQLGTLFFVTNIVSSISALVASSMAKRIGLIRTMVFTHLPSSILLALIPLPSQGWLAMIFLVLRSSLANMDQAPRQAFIATAVLPNERTAVMGIVNVVKTLSQSGGPVVTGWLAGVGKFWIAFLIAGAMKASYDLAMLKMFVSYKSREDEEKRRKQPNEQENGHLNSSP